MVRTQNTLKHKWCKLGAIRFHPGAAAAPSPPQAPPLEEAAADSEGGLVVGLPSRGLDGRLHPGLRHAGGDDPDAPHGFVVVRVRPVRHHHDRLGVRLLRLRV